MRRDAGFVPIVLGLVAFVGGSLVTPTSAWGQSGRSRRFGGTCGFRGACGPSPICVRPASPCFGRPWPSTPFSSWRGSVCRPFIVPSPVLYYPSTTSVSGLIVTNPPPIYAPPPAIYVQNGSAYSTTYPRSPVAMEDGNSLAYGLRAPAPPAGAVENDLAEAMWQLQKQQAAQKAAQEAAAKAQADRTAQVDELLSRGDQAFRTGHYDQAHNEYVRALVLAGDDARVRIPLGLADFARGRFADAGRTVRLGVALSGPMPSWEKDLRDAYARPDDFEKHKAALEAFLRESPDYCDAWFLLGFVRFYSGDRPGAVAAFQRYHSRPGADPAVAPFIEQVKRPS